MLKGNPADEFHVAPSLKRHRSVFRAPKLCGADRGFFSVRIPTKPAMHSNSKPAGYSDLMPATRGVVRTGQIHDVVEGWEGQETG